MKLSVRTLYALKAMLHLALLGNGSRTTTAASIASNQNIPTDFLRHIMLTLQRAGLVTSIRGRAGGYVLGRKPDQIMFGDVLRLFEGQMFRVNADPSAEPGKEPHATTMAIQRVCERMASEVFKHADTITLQHLSAEARSAMTYDI